MDLATIVDRAARAYPEAWVLHYFNLERDAAVTSQAGGDGLAEFIAWELYETFDPETDDDAQIRVAVETLRSAEHRIHAVVVALENMKPNGGLSDG